MRRRLLDHRTGWLFLGLVAGLIVSYFWSDQPAQALTNSRSDKFEIFTVSAAAGNEGVFVLDHMTGQLRGSVLDPQSHKFTVFYSRDLAKDFRIDDLEAKPQFAVVAGNTQLQNRPGMRVRTAPTVIYVAELTSGKILSYIFPWERTTRAKKPPHIEIVPVASFQFREADAL